MIEDGLKGVGVATVWILPVLLIICPAMIGSLVLSIGASETSDNPGIWLIGNLVLTALQCLIYPFVLAVQFVAPVALSRVAVTGTFRAGLEVGPVLRTVRARFVDYLVVFLLSLASSSLASIGTVACCVGVFFALVYASLLNAHLWGQAYRRAAAGGVPELAQPG